MLYCCASRYAKILHRVLDRNLYIIILHKKIILIKYVVKGHNVKIIYLFQDRRCPHINKYILIL